MVHAASNRVKFHYEKPPKLDVPKKRLYKAEGMFQERMLDAQYKGMTQSEYDEAVIQAKRYVEKRYNRPLLRHRLAGALLKLVGG